MKISEIYRSIQGEGILTGTESLFLRTSGCNLRCRFCDTPYTSWSPEGEDLSVNEIMDRLEEWDCHHVVLTGGEPMLFSELIPLTQRLRQQQRHITIETAGTLYLPVTCDLMSISPKLSNSTPSVRREPRWSRRHEEGRFVPEVVRRLVSEYRYQIKFVIDSPKDCVEVDHYLERIPEIARTLVLLMPQGVTRDELGERSSWLRSYCRENQLKFCPRRQVEWFGMNRAT